MKFTRLIKLFRRLLIRGVKTELKYATSLDGCIENAAIDMIKALYAAYHGLDCAEAIGSSDMLTEWACNVLSQIQRDLQGGQLNG